MNISKRSKNIFDYCRTEIMMNFESLYLGHFFTYTSKTENLSNKAVDLDMDTGINKFLLEKDIIKNSLEHMYNRYLLPDFFSRFIDISVVRGITITTMEMLEVPEIKKLFIKYIFKNDENTYQKGFRQILRFIRNVFSHIARDRIELKKSDYADIANKYPVINFYFDYDGVFPGHIHRINRIIDIDIDFSTIKDGNSYTSIISDYETILFVKLCHDYVGYLNEIMMMEEAGPYNLRKDLSNKNMLASDIYKNFSKSKGFESLKEYIEYLICQIDVGINLELFNKLDEYERFKNKNQLYSE